MQGHHWGVGFLFDDQSLEVWLTRQMGCSLRLLALLRWHVTQPFVASQWREHPATSNCATKSNHDKECVATFALCGTQAEECPQDASGGGFDDSHDPVTGRWRTGLDGD